MIAAFWRRRVARWQSHGPFTWRDAIGWALICGLVTMFVADWPHVQEMLTSAHFWRVMAILAVWQTVTEVWRRHRAGRRLARLGRYIQSRLAEPQVGSEQSSGPLD
jgi:hypothetical protein